MEGYRNTSLYLKVSDHEAISQYARDHGTNMSSLVREGLAMVTGLELAKYPFLGGRAQPRRKAATVLAKLDPATLAALKELVAEEPAAYGEKT